MVFKVPSGKAGKSFVEEMSNIIGYYTNGTAMEEIAITMVMIMPALLLQKPSKNSKSKLHAEYLEKRLSWWKKGDISSLIKEGEAIQKKLVKGKISKEHKEKVFVRLMLQGKVSSAMRWIGSQSTSLLQVDEEVLKVLKEQHPSPAQTYEGSLISGPKEIPEEVIYESIDGDLIEHSARNISGAAGPSGLDADGWKRILCSKQFTTKSKALADNIAGMARKLCTAHITPHHLEAL